MNYFLIDDGGGGYFVDDGDGVTKLDDGDAGVDYDDVDGGGAMNLVMLNLVNKLLFDVSLFYRHLFHGTPLQMDYDLF